MTANVALCLLGQPFESIFLDHSRRMLEFNNQFGPMHWIVDREKSLNKYGYLVVKPQRA